MRKSTERAQTPTNSVVRNIAAKGSKEATDGPHGFLPEDRLCESCEKKLQPTPAYHGREGPSRKASRKRRSKKRRNLSPDAMARGTHPNQSLNVFFRLMHGESSYTHQKSHVSTTVFTRLGARDKNIFTRLGERRKDIHSRLGPKVASHHKHASDKRRAGFDRSAEDPNHRRKEARNLESNKRHDRFTPLIKTPKEILAMDTVKFKASPPMPGPVKNQNKHKFCEFHGDKGYNTNECIHLKKQLEEAVRAQEISFSPLASNDGQETLMVVEAEIEGHLIHQMYVNRGSASEDGVVMLYSSTVVPTECRMVTEAPVELPANAPTIETWIKIATHPEQNITRGKSLSEKGRMKLCDLLRNNLDVFSWKPTDMTGVLSLKNARATYQRLVDKAFKKQIGRNLEKKDIPRPCCQHEGNQGMFGKGKNSDKATISKDAEGSAKPQRKAGKHAERAFQEMKQCIAELPLLIAPKPKEELIMYLCAAREAVSAVLLEKRDSQQMAIYFVSRALQAQKINYSSIKNLILYLVHASRRLRRTAHSETYGSQNLKAKVDFRLVANQINGSYIAKEQSMIQYLEKAKMLISSLKKFSIELVPRSENKKADTLSKIAYTSFTHLTKKVLVEVLKEKSIKEKEILVVIKEEGHSWMILLLEYLTDGTLPAETKKARAIKI
nr:reverse transcriptase domain-containing protein [Tanacetum cinerariifolium]